MSLFSRFIRSLLLFTPLLAVVVGCNFLFDPAHLFSDTGYYKEVVSMMLSGGNVANLVNYDDRRLQKLLVSELPDKKDIVVLGSSRTMLIHKELFPGHTFMNSSVAAATLNDDMAIYWMYRSRNLLPRVIIIGLDPWLLNGGNDDSRWQANADEYGRLNQYTGGQNDVLAPFRGFLEKYYQLISPTYFQQSFRIGVASLRSWRLDLHEFYPTTDYLGSQFIKHSDGSVSYPATYRNSTPAETLIAAKAYASRVPIDYLGGFSEMDPGLIDKFDRFVRLMRNDHVRVVFFLPAYHPIVYEAISRSDQYRNVITTQRFFEHYAEDNGIELVGSYNPADNGLSGPDFYDGHHCNLSAIDRLMKPVSKALGTSAR